MIISVVYLFVRCLLGCLMMLARYRVSKDAELLDRMLIVNEHHLRRVLTEYLLHYNDAWPRRSLGQLTPAQAETHPPKPVNLAEFQIRRKQILGGFTHE